MLCDPATNGFAMTGANTGTYVLGQGGQELTQLSGSGAWQRTNVFAGGRQLATYDMVGASPALHFQLTDPLGTRRMQTSSVGQPETDIQSLPYGDQLSSTTDPDAPATADDATPLHFTGKERDSETGEENGNDYFGARYYASSMGRFLSPDWAAKIEPVPYAKMDDPQSLNLYSYVGNNPLDRTDPDGHCSQGDAAICAKITQDMWRKNMDAGAAMAAEAQQQVTAKAAGTFVTYTYPDGSTMVLSGTHPWRDNNPGDLTGGHGAIGLDKGIAIYPSQEAGWNALFATLQGKYQDYTLSQLANTYDPPCGSPCTNPMLKGNDPVKYANDLAGMVGVGTGAKLSGLSSAQIMQVGISISQLEGMTNPHIQNTMVWNAPPQP